MKYTLPISVIMFLLLGCSTSMKVSVTDSSDDGVIEFAIVHINDVYEIAGVSGGSLGNLARVQGFYEQTKAKYPNTLLTHGGDLLNPSLINTMQYEGESIKGRQMVEVMNAMDIDLVAFGNHEFDLDLEDLQKRLNESEFDWIATNLGQVCGESTYPFHRVKNGNKEFFPRTVVRTLKDQDGTEIQIGFFSATLEDNQRDYIHYFDPDSCAHVAIQELKNVSDIQIGLTHLGISDDEALARDEPDVPLILGGHDHDNMLRKAGNAVISKADANAKTVYLHILTYNKRTGELNIKSDLVEMNDSVQKDSEVQAVIDKWDDILEREVGQIVDDPYGVIYYASEPLDGRESSIRNFQTNLGVIIAESFIDVSTQNPVASIINSGGVRIDDQLYGEITSVDIFRVLPFGGSVYDVKISGALLRDVLDYSNARTGTGAYIQRYNIEDEGGNWSINGEMLMPEKEYQITMNDFLLSGYDIPLLTKESEGIISISEPKDTSDPRMDVRVAVIDWMKKNNPGK